MGREDCLLDWNLYHHIFWLERLQLTRAAPLALLTLRFVDCQAAQPLYLKQFVLLDSPCSSFPAPPPPQPPSTPDPNGLNGSVSLEHCYTSLSQKSFQGTSPKHLLYWKLCILYPPKWASHLPSAHVRTWEMWPGSFPSLSGSQWSPTKARLSFVVILLNCFFFWVSIQKFLIVFFHL